VTSAGGFIASSNFEVHGDGGRARIDVRVPSDELQSFLADISKLGTPIDLRQDTLDITRSVNSNKNDLRVKNARLQSLLRQLAAATTDSDRERLTLMARQARSEINALETQEARLHEKASVVPVSLTVRSAEKGERVTKEHEPTSLQGIWDRSQRVLSVMAAAAALIATIAIPPLVLVGLFLVIRKRRRR
jgi:hypothetical protein